MSIWKGKPHCRLPFSYPFGLCFLDCWMKCLRPRTGQKNTRNPRGYGNCAEQSSFMVQPLGRDRIESNVEIEDIFEFANSEQIKDNPRTKYMNLNQTDHLLSGGVHDSPHTSIKDSSESSCSDESIGSDELPVGSHCFQARLLINNILQRKKSIKRICMSPPIIARSVRCKSSFQPRTKWPVLVSLHKQVGAPSLDWWKPSWRAFNYQELAAATDNFSSENLIGKGGHAEVYKGHLADGELVAVKKLIKKTEEECVGYFLSELGIIAHIDHPNVVYLLGFGIARGLYLIFNFCQHGSLASALHGSSSTKKLDWRLRFQIAMGMAEGLLYLHQGCHRRIIHRDIKASNILLTRDYQPQISDFGLAKWLPDQSTHCIFFPIEGTFGYLAPEYFMHGVVSEKTDVFAFGVLLLELITGRQAIDSTQQSLVLWAKPLLEANDPERLIDPQLKGAYDPTEMSSCISAASTCINHLSTARPYMKQVVLSLNGEDAPKRQPDVGEQNMFNAGSLEEDSACFNFLGDLNNHKQLALKQ